MKKALFSYVHHQPELKEFSYFDISKPGDLQPSNKDLVEGINSRITSLINFLSISGSHCISIAMSGPVLDYLESDTNQLNILKKFIKGGQLELVASPAYNSLSILFSSQLFETEINEGVERIKELFGLDPIGFTNSVLMYSDSLADKLNPFGFDYALAPRIPWFIKNQTDVVFKSKRVGLKLILPDSQDESDSDRKAQVILINSEKGLSQDDADFTLLSELAKAKKAEVYKLPDLVAIDLQGKGIDSLVGNNLQRDFLNRLKEVSISVVNQTNTELTKRLFWIGSVNHFRALSKSVKDNTRYANYTTLLNLLYDLEIQLR